MDISRKRWSHFPFGTQQTVSTSGWRLLPHFTAVAGSQHGKWTWPTGRGTPDCSKGHFHFFIKTTISASWKDSEYVPRGVPIYFGSKRGHQCDPIGGWLLWRWQQWRGMQFAEWNNFKAQWFHYLQETVKLVEIKERKSTALYKNAADCNVTQQLPQVVMVTLNCCLFLLTVSQFHF